MPARSALLFEESRMNPQVMLFSKTPREAAPYERPRKPMFSSQTPAARAPFPVFFSFMPDFPSAADSRVLVSDGAMGTMLYTKGIFISRSFDELNLSHPQLVRDTHLEYIQAGADIIETNTFGANRTKLMSHGLLE